MKIIYFTLVIILSLFCLQVYAQKTEVFEDYDLGDGSYKLWFTGGDKEEGDENFVITDKKVLKQVKSKLNLIRVYGEPLCIYTYYIHLTKNDSVVGDGKVMFTSGCGSLVFEGRSYDFPHQLASFLEKNKGPQIEHKAIRDLNIPVARKKIDSLSVIAENKLVFKSFDWYAYDGKIYLKFLKYDPKKIGLKDRDSLEKDMAVRVKKFNPNLQFKIETYTKFPSRRVPYFQYGYDIYLNSKKEDELAELLNYLLKGEDPARKSFYRILPRVVDIGYYEIVEGD